MVTDASESIKNSTHCVDASTSLDINHNKSNSQGNPTCRTLLMFSAGENL